VALSAAGESATDPKFSTDGKSLSYIRNHNLVVKRVDGGAGKALTTNGDENLLNGEVDWVYGEELDVRSNYFWSHRFEEDCAPANGPDQGPHLIPSPISSRSIPRFTRKNIPRWAIPNPQVQLGVVSARGGEVRWFHLTHDKDIYTRVFGWVSDYVVWATVLNRAQNQLDLYLWTPPAANRGACSARRAIPGSRLDNNLQFLKSVTSSLWPSWRDGHTHLYLYSFDKSQSSCDADAKLVNQITKCDFEVFDVEGGGGNTYS